MKIKRGLFVTFSVLLVYTYTYSFSSGDLNPTTPENLFEGFAAAVKSGDEAKAETLGSKKALIIENHHHPTVYIPG